MIGSLKRNVLLLAALIAVAAGVWLFNVRRTEPTEAKSVPQTQERALAQFATMRSAHQATAEQV
ncbi:MAG: hypothetical protein JWO95_1782, partial [Verrucomicrobiales bacterium]|nr:hypothetical protein [Verrucomicrobiales bacterium]